MPRSTETIPAVRGDSKNNIRAFSPNAGRRRYDLFRRQLAVYTAATRRQTPPGRTR